MADDDYPPHHPHHHHHYDHRRHDDADDYPPPPPRPDDYDPFAARPNPPPHQPGYATYPQNPGPFAPPPPEQPYGEYAYGRARPHEYEPHLPAPPVEHVSHDARPPPRHDGTFEPGKPTVKIYCKAGEGFCLTVRDGVVCLAPEDHRDDRQHWIQDLRYSTRVKDEEGYPAFSLINKATGEALKHAVGQEHPVRLLRYNPDYMDESLLWTESKDVGAGFRCIRMVNNIYLNFDAFHGDKDHGGVHDGTTLTVWKWCEGDNQRWKIVPW